MADFPIDTKVTGGGNQGAVNAYRLVFPDAALAGAPILEAYTAAGTPPTLTVGANVDSTFSASDSSVYAIPTFGVVDETTLNNWAENLTDGDANNFTNSPAYNANGKKLKGTDSILQLVPDTEVSFPAGYTAAFNWAYRLGPNSATAANANDHVLACRYIYTGGVDPNPTWQANEGTEAVPVWSDLNGVVAKKLKHADAGSIAVNPVLTKPTSGNIWSSESVAQNA